MHLSQTLSRLQLFFESREENWKKGIIKETDTILCDKNEGHFGQKWRPNPKMVLAPPRHYHTSIQPPLRVITTSLHQKINRTLSHEIDSACPMHTNLRQGVPFRVAWSQVINYRSQSCWAWMQMWLTKLALLPGKSHRITTIPFKSHKQLSKANSHLSCY